VIKIYFLNRDVKSNVVERTSRNVHATRASHVIFLRIEYLWDIEVSLGVVHSLNGTVEDVDAQVLAGKGRIEHGLPPWPPGTPRNGPGPGNCGSVSCSNWCRYLVVCKYRY
jgi:hypothetical protein